MVLDPTLLARYAVDGQARARSRAYPAGLLLAWLDAVRAARLAVAATRALGRPA